MRGVVLLPTSCLFLNPDQIAFMAKLKLDFEPDYSFYLIAIACHEKKHKIAWAVGQAIHFDLEKVDDHQALMGKTSSEWSSFSHYQAEDEGGHYQMHLIANTGSSGRLIPEQKQADFFLVITGNYNGLNLNQLTNSIKAQNIVLTAYPIDPKTLKHKDRLILE